MQWKTFLQLFLLFISLLISVIIFKNYFIKEDLNSTLKPTETTVQEETSSKKNSNIMEGMEYTSEDGEGNNYIIKSEYGELNNDKQELILMKSVTATINFTNSESIRIFADEAIYNSVNYNTAFSKNVLVTHGEHTINSNNLDIMFEKNLISISNEVIYKNLNTKLAADMVEIDLVTKSSKIFMNNKLDKVNIISLN
tara:strand:+ start:32 stop:622 length:591 start_codon:yes stop_codon:yes gene_type:complete